MNDSSDVDDAIERVRDAFDDAVTEAETLSERAREDVETAIDDLEARIEELRGSE